MNLQEFVQEVLVQLDGAVDEATKVTSRDIRFSENDNNRTIEFDIAVSVEEWDKKEGKAGIRVLELAETGGKISKENKNSNTSRIIFGLRVSPSTKLEMEESSAAVRRHNQNLKNTFPNSTF